MIYQFSKGNRRKIKPDMHKPSAPIAITEEVPPIGIVQGRTPDSKAEWIVALALDEMQWPYYFQFSVRGGSTRAGGSITDFMILTKPFMTPLYIDGKYWHDSSTKFWDEFKRQMVQIIFRGRIMPNVIIKAEKITSIPVAKSLLRKEIRI